jgi:glutathione synthase/RimK-type ligase-like ATP-grasp enzyme
VKPRIWVYSGDRPSNGAKALAGLPGFLRLRDGRFHKVRHTDWVINWGVSKSLPQPLDCNLVQKPKVVALATDKLIAFKAFAAANVSCVPWTTSYAKVEEWLDNRKTVVARKVLTGHSGNGIVIIEPDETEVLMAPLYTQYIFKTKEFRVHVVGSKVIDTQQKIKDPDQEVKTWKVRSHANGFIFARNGIVPSAGRDELAIAAVHALGLDFGAVDIIEDKKGNLFVLEVNTAPGLEGQTVDNYGAAFKELVNEG